ncbi:helix-turn-helix transcriptional regulator [Phormidium tenue FACHB-886]|nr:helix-turn-helix transcriptional regulator [Phormidium tenue FACHB-886]
MVWAFDILDRICRMKTSRRLLKNHFFNTTDLGVSSGFANLFKQAMGISPHRYVIQQRVERAKSLPSKTDLAIADIALRVGFSSQSHLTQQFKRFTGMTPKQVHRTQ